jgi:hypothetical protein
MRHCHRHKTHSSSPIRQTTNKTTTTTVTTTAKTTMIMTHPLQTRWPNRKIQETTKTRNREIKECADRDARTRGPIVNMTTTL